MMILAYREYCIILLVMVFTNIEIKYFLSLVYLTLKINTWHVLSSKLRTL